MSLYCVSQLVSVGYWIMFEFIIKQIWTWELNLGIFLASILNSHYYFVFPQTAMSTKGWHSYWMIQLHNFCPFIVNATGGVALLHQAEKYKENNSSSLMPETRLCILFQTSYHLWTMQNLELWCKNIRHPKLIKGTT